MAKALTADLSTDAKGKKKKSKKNLWRKIGLGFLAFIVFIVWFGMQPLTGPVQVGICRTFIEMNLRYPHTLKLTKTDQYQDSLRLYYTYTGPFGEHRSSLTECRFAADPATGQPMITKIKTDRVDIDPEKVRLFNQTIPSIVQHEPNRIIPPPYTSDLNDLRR